MIHGNPTSEFLLTVAPILVAPGPSTFLVSAEATRDVTSVPGIIAGDLTANAGQIALVGWLTSAVGELAGVEQLRPLKWIGVVYLVALAASRLNPRPAEAAPTSSSRGFLRGFLVSASNPKALVFLFGLFPAFLDTAIPLAAQLLLLGSLYLLLDGLCLAGYAVVGRRLARSGRSSTSAGADRLAAGLLLAAAVLLAVR